MLWYICIAIFVTVRHCVFNRCLNLDIETDTDLKLEVEKEEKAFWDVLFGPFLEAVYLNFKK